MNSTTAPQRNGVLRAFEVVLILLGSEIALASIFALASVVLSSKWLTLALGSSLTRLLPYAPTLLFVRARGTRIGLVETRPSISSREVGAWCVLTVAMALSFAVSFRVMAGVEPRGETVVFAGSTFYRQLEDLAVDLVLAPVLEEVIFRGIVLAALILSMSRVVAVLLSAVVFSLSHLSIPDLPGSMILGLVAGLVFVRSGRIQVSILVHCAWNTAIVVARTL